ncbi:hypothetical protein FQZ97_681230 [compost metagenome]
MGVAPGQHRAGAFARLLAVGAAGIDAADVDAAEEGDAPIDDQQLAVVALVHRPAGLGGQRVDRVELQHLDTDRAEAGEELARGAEGADAVADQVDLYTGQLLGDQRIGEALADFVVFENVGFQVDVIESGVDRIDHRPIGSGTVLQQFDLVAGGQGAADDGFFDCQVQLEDIGVGTARLQTIENGLAACGRERPTGPVELHRRRNGARHIGRESRQ